MDEIYYFIYNNSFVTVTGDYHWHSDIAENLGTSLEDFTEGKYVLLNEEQVAFLKEHGDATPEEAWNMAVRENANSNDIGALIERIEDYDSSEEVNKFFVNDTPVWFNKEVRTSLNSSLSIEKEVGRETTVLWINNTPYTISVDEAKRIISEVELYAVECYNNTQKNIAEAKTLTLKEEVTSFDITKGYPEKPRFTI